MNTDAIKAGKHFQIDRGTRLKHAALRLALSENQMRPECRDMGHVRRICTRFKVAREYAFYTANPELIAP